VPALGLVSAFAVLLAWLANPYLALLLVPVAHVWLLDARREAALPWPMVIVGALVSVVPIAAAVGHISSRLDLGSAAPWRLLLIVGTGQIGFGEMLALCLLLGCLVGIVAVAMRGRAAAARPRAPSRRVPSRTPAHDRDLAYGHDLDASPIARSGLDDDLGGGR
jgi:4-hydroxybenzoate polyprenyltransferase